MKRVSLIVLVAVLLTAPVGAQGDDPKWEAGKGISACLGDDFTVTAEVLSLWAEEWMLLSDQMGSVSSYTQVDALIEGASELYITINTDWVPRLPYCAEALWVESLMQRGTAAMLVSLLMVRTDNMAFEDYIAQVQVVNAEMIVFNEQLQALMD